jgi:hypothetical protein
MLFDIVILVGPNDIEIINTTLEYNKKNIIGYNKIYIIINKDIITNYEIFQDCEIIDENIFPFNKELIKKFLNINTNRTGWYLQQLLKLYAGFIINGILENYLVIDADTYFLKPTTFFENNLPLYNYGTEYHLPYFIHMINLHPEFTKMIDKSGICHHMIFQKYILINLFNLVEKFHNDKFYNIFLKSIENNQSGASEYEIYFNYMIKYFPNHFKIRPLNWENVNKIIDKNYYDYVSYHWYLRV